MKSTGQDFAGSESISLTTLSSVTSDSSSNGHGSCRSTGCRWYAEAVERREMTVSAIFLSLAVKKPLNSSHSSAASCGLVHGGTFRIAKSELFTVCMPYLICITECQRSGEKLYNSAHVNDIHSNCVYLVPFLIYNQISSVNRNFHTTLNICHDVWCKITKTMGYQMVKRSLVIF